MYLFHRIAAKKMLHVLIIFCFIFPGHSLCKQDKHSADVGLSFAVATPKGEFRDNVTREGYGLFLEGLYMLGKGSPVKMGLKLGFLNYGIETRNEPLSTTIPDLTVGVRTNNNIFLGHIILRLTEQFGSVAPYVDGLAGFNYLFTDTSLEDLRDYETIASSTNISDTAFSYGFGGGLMVKVSTFKYKGKRNGLFVDLKVHYIYGGEAEYLKKGSIKREGGNVYYSSHYSRTDLLLYQLGVAWRF